MKAIKGFLWGLLIAAGLIAAATLLAGAVSALAGWLTS